MKKFYLVINKGDYIHLINSVKDINRYDDISNHKYIYDGYKKYIYDFHDWKSGLKWMKETNKQHFYLVEMKLTKKELSINKKHLQQEL